MDGSDFVEVPAEMFHPYIGGKKHTQPPQRRPRNKTEKPQLDTLKRVGRIFSFHPHHCFPPRQHSSVPTELSQLMICLLVENECVSEYLCGALPHPDYWAVLCD